MTSQMPYHYTTANLVTREMDAGVAVLALDNPPVNALSRDLREAIRNGINELAANDEVQAIVLLGKNGTFIAGADLREFGKPLTDPTLPDVIEAIESCHKPVVAAIEGAALGGGYEIALACDGRVALETSAVGLPEGTFGIIPGAGGTVRLTRVTDAVTALELISSCRQVKAPEAKSLGLIDAIVGELRSGAIAYARNLGKIKNRLRDKGPKQFNQEAFDAAVKATLKHGKGRPYVFDQTESVWRGVTEPFDVALAEARAIFQRLRDSDESAALRHLFFAERQAGRVDGLADAVAIQVRTVGIVGAGTMGSGIAAAFLAAGYPVKLTDLKTEALENAAERIRGFLAKASNPAVLTLVNSVEELSDCDLLLEAVFEDLKIKTDLLAHFDRVAKPGAILASNTSYLDLDQIAAVTGRPDSVVGLHFFAPAHIMKLLEIVRGKMTSPEVLRSAFTLARRLRKVAVVSGVAEGFIGNRIYNAYRAQCEAMLMDGATPREVDAAIEAIGFAMGPFAVSDMSGLDIAWANRKRRQEATGDKSKDVPVLEWLVASGRLGRKTGSGWYRYADGQSQPDAGVFALIEQARQERGALARTLNQDELQDRALSAIVNEALLVLEDGIAACASDIDLVLINGYGFPRHLGGPLYWAKQQPRDQLDQNLATVSAGGRRGNSSLLD